MVMIASPQAADWSAVGEKLDATRRATIVRSPCISFWLRVKDTGPSVTFDRTDFFQPPHVSFVAGEFCVQE
jgi:hypothetical protein